MCFPRPPRQWPSYHVSATKGCLAWALNLCPALLQRRRRRRWRCPRTKNFRQQNVCRGCLLFPVPSKGCRRQQAQESRNPGLSSNCFLSEAVELRSEVVEISCLLANLASRWRWSWSWSWSTNSFSLIMIVNGRTPRGKRQAGRQATNLIWCTSSDFNASHSIPPFRNRLTEKGT